MKLRDLCNSFYWAVKGIVYAFKTQRNMKFHFLAAGLVLILTVILDFNRYELSIIFISITLVLAFELFNTAVEAAVDLYNDEYHHLAEIAKNTAAGAVFITCVNAVLVAVIIILPKLI